LQFRNSLIHLKRRQAPLSAESFRLFDQLAPLLGDGLSALRQPIGNAATAFVFAEQWGDVDAKSLRGGGLAREHPAILARVDHR
jgi:hypothetical protein